MSTFLKILSSKINELNDRVGKATSWLTFVLMIIVFLDVIARKLFNYSKIWIMDIEWHLFALIFLLSAGYALKHDRHVRVDLFYEKFSVKEKAQTNFWGHLLFLVPWCIMAIYFSYGYALEAWHFNEGSPEPGGLPARYLIKFCITLGVFLLLLQAIAGIIDSGLILFGKDDKS